MDEQIGTPGRMRRATVVGRDCEESAGVVDQCQRLGARQSRFHTGRRDQPHFVDSSRTQASLGPGNENLVDPRREVEQELITRPAHQGALEEHFVKPQPSTADWTLPAKGHQSTVLSLLICRHGFDRSVSYYRTCRAVLSGYAGCREVVFSCTTGRAYVGVGKRRCADS